MDQDVWELASIISAMKRNGLIFHIAEGESAFYITDINQDTCKQHPALQMRKKLSPLYEYRNDIFSSASFEILANFAARSASEARFSAT